MRLSIGIVAGGKSAKLGQNDALTRQNDKRFMERITKELGGFSQTLISVAKKGMYEELNLPVVYDEHEQIGPMEGIYQVVKHAAEEYVFVCGADMPFVTKELVQYMARQITEDYDCFVLMDEERIHPLCAIYSKRVLPVIEKLIAQGQYRLMNIMNAVRTKYIDLNTAIFAKKVVRNINKKSESQGRVLYKDYSEVIMLNPVNIGLIYRIINGFIQTDYWVGLRSVA